MCMCVCMCVCVYVCIYTYPDPDPENPEPEARSQPGRMAGPGKLQRISRTIFRVIPGKRWSCHKKRGSRSYPSWLQTLYFLFIPPLARPKSKLFVGGPARCRFVPAFPLGERPKRLTIFILNCMIHSPTEIFLWQTKVSVSVFDCF